jgi:glycine cleavage system regulatory protein
MMKSLVVTVIGPDRPGIVSLLSDRARGFGANWAASRMASLAGQCAGMVHFEVPAENAGPLASALAGLESTGLRIVIAASDAKSDARHRRVVQLELVGQDRPGIMRDLSARLAERGVSIDELHADRERSDVRKICKVKAILGDRALFVPYVMPGFDLARRVATAWAGTKRAPSPSDRPLQRILQSPSPMLE